MLCAKDYKESAENLVRYNQLKNMLMERFEKIQKKYKLKKSELMTVAALMMAGEENTSTDLCKITGMNKAQISKNFDALTKRGIVRSETDHKDRRFVHYFIAEGGRDITEDLLEAWYFVRGCLFKGVAEEDVATFVAVSKQMHKNVYEMTRGEKEETTKSQTND